MKILLINPPIEDFFFTPQRAYPTGILSLGTILKKDGFEIKILNCLESYKKEPLKFPRDFYYLKRYYQPNNSPFRLFSNFYRFGLGESEILKVVKDFRPQLVGISANFTCYLDSTFYVADLIKRNNKKIIIVVGGHAATVQPEIFLDNHNIDFVIRGEAEFAFLKLCRILRGRERDFIDGVCYRTKKNKFVISNVALVENLNSLPIINRELIDYKKYIFKGSISTALYTSRGCNRKCSFCAIRQPFRFRSVKNVLAEVEYCYKLGIRHFNFEDDNVNLNPYFEQLLDSLIERFEGKIKISFMNGLLSLRLNKRMLSKLIRAGLTHLDLSMVSSSNVLRKNMQRTENIRNIFAIANFLASSRILTTVHFIIAYPKQRFKDIVRDIKLLARKKVLAGPSIFYLVIESDIFKRLSINTSDYKFFRSSTAYFDKYISRDRIFLILYFSRIVNFIKELTLKLKIKKVRLMSLLEKQVGSLLVNNNYLFSHTKLDRLVIGMLLLKKLLKEKLIYRIILQKKDRGFLYHFIKEEFVRKKDVEILLNNLTVEGLNGEILRI